MSLFGYMLQFITRELSDILWRSLRNIRVYRLALAWGGQRGSGHARAAVCLWLDVWGGARTLGAAEEPIR